MRLPFQIAFIGRSQVDGINYSSLSSNLGITKYKAEQYAAAFENGGKGRSQFKGIQADRKIVMTEGASLSEDRMPLQLAGFLA